MIDLAIRTADVSSEIQALDRSLATIVFAPDGTIVRANTKFLALFGYTSQSIVGLHHAMFVPPDEVASEGYDALWATLRRGESQAVECRRVRKDGSDIWIEATYTPVFDDQRCVVAIVQFATDLSEQKLRAADDRGQIDAIHSSHAVIHFELDGTIKQANAVFLTTMGYRLDDVVGRHHSLFVEPAHAGSDAYREFWADLGRGLHKTVDDKYTGKDGREVWLRATYNPISDMNGKPFKIVTYAEDVTRERLRQIDYEGQVAAIQKSQGVITFDMHGTILHANANFLDAIGYELHEIEGRHHRMFVDPSYAHGPEYATFWDELSRGRHQAGEYKRVGKNGREVWFQATYNPVLDLNGRPFKIVKCATVVTREKLRQADLQGQIASIHKAQCVVSFAVDGTILDANDNFLAATGYRLSEVRGRHHRMFVDPMTAETADYAVFWSELARGRHQTGEFQRLCKGGRQIWVQATYNPIFDMSGRPFKIVKYALDVTEDRLRKADHEGQITAIRKSQCVVAFDLDGVILDANENFLTTMGYRRDEVEGRHHRMFVEPSFADTEGYAAFWTELRAGKFLSAKFKRLGKGGREVWIQASYNPILDLNGRPFKIIKIATDISADVALAADLTTAKRQAEHDAATALPNRVQLRRFMTEVLSRPNARLAVLYMDLDHFKPINDTFGHHVGDHVLVETATRLRLSLASDQLVARVGGDEFVVAAPNLSDEQIEAFCQRLIATLKAPIRHEKGTLNVGLSIGVAVAPSDAATVDGLLRCADVALYRSKGHGRGAYSFFSNATSERIAADRYLAYEMRHGIKAGHFFLEFQPRFNARTRTVQSVEALVRWAHPERGRIEPPEFLPIADMSGLIVPLTEWVLRAACQAAKDWPGVGVSVNISPTEFRGSDLVEVVDAVLNETKLDAERLELEITEGCLLEDESRARTVLKALKARGVGLVLDNFGAGLSSLGYLRSFPFDRIKLDRTFLTRIEGQDEGRAIVQGILGLGRALGIAVTTEGVETTGQLLLLSLDDRSEVQGFLLARPMDVAAVSALLDAQSVGAVEPEGDDNLSSGAVSECKAVRHGGPSGLIAGLGPESPGRPQGLTVSG